MCTVMSLAFVWLEHVFVCKQKTTYEKRISDWSSDVCSSDLSVLGFTMPGFATGETTRSNAWKLMKALGVTGEGIDIRPAARQMLGDMGHPFARGAPVDRKSVV